MAESSGLRKWLLGCAVLLGLSFVGCCCCGSLGLYFWKDIAVWAVTTDAPLDMPATPYDPAQQQAVQERIVSELTATGATSISAAELNVLLSAEEDARAHVAMAGDQLTVDFTVRLEPGVERYVNLHLASSFEIKDGWFTHLFIPELVVSDWDIGQYTVGNDLANDANQNLAKQKADAPELDALFSAIQAMTVRDGRLEVTADMARLGTLAGPGGAP